MTTILRSYDIMLTCSYAVVQAIDSQVEQLAVGLGKTVGSVVGGLGGAVKMVRLIGN